MNVLICSNFNREAREAAELTKHRAERPKIQQQFADLKRGLSVVTDEEWENIPEVGNLTRKKRKKEERSFVVPDSVLVGDRSKNEYESAIDPMQQQVQSFFSFSNVAHWMNSLVDLRHQQNPGPSRTSSKLAKRETKFCPSSLIRSVIQSPFLPILCIFTMCVLSRYRGLHPLPGQQPQLTPRDTLQILIV